MRGSGFFFKDAILDLVHQKLITCTLDPCTHKAPLLDYNNFTSKNNTVVSCKEKQKPSSV